jgi:hypothetical protein
MENTITEGQLVLSKCLSAYAECRRYQCSGKLLRTIKTQQLIVTIFKMQLAYTYPRQMFLQWWNKSPGPNHHTMIACDGAVVRYSGEDFEWSINESIEDVLPRYAGRSGGLAMCIPSILIDSKACSLLKRVHGAVKVKRYILINGLVEGDIERTITIRMSDYAITKIHDAYTIPGGVVECTSTFSRISFWHKDKTM